MKGSLVTRSAVILTGLLTLLWLSAETAAAATATATAAATMAHARMYAANRNVDLHAHDSKISRIQATATSDDESTDVDVWPHIAGPILQHRRMQGLPVQTATSSMAKMAKSVTDGRKLSNHDLLRSLGMEKLNIPSSHHRKRLAVESRHHSRPDDSHMYIIKLPPNQVYYTKTSGHDRNAIGDTKKKVTVDFRSNGKPGRIYHWNLPVLKHMLAQETANHNGHHHQAHNSNGISARHVTNSRLSNDISELIDIRHIPTWPKQPWENETIDKASTATAYRKNDRNINSVGNDMVGGSMLGGIGAAAATAAYQKKSPSFYAPRPKKSAAANVQKYFPGNGKPKSFYVIKGKSQTTHYQTLIP